MGLRYDGVYLRFITKETLVIEAMNLEVQKQNLDVKPPRLVVPRWVYNMTDSI